MREPDAAKLAWPYVPPWNTPLYWGDEVSGQLVGAVMRFYDHTLAGAELLESEFQMVVSYCQYVIESPCWDNNPFANKERRESLTRLRAIIPGVRTAAELQAWIDGCLNLGIDPL